MQRPFEGANWTEALAKVHAVSEEYRIVSVETPASGGVRIMVDLLGVVETPATVAAHASRPETVSAPPVGSLKAAGLRSMKDVFTDFAGRPPETSGATTGAGDSILAAAAVAAEPIQAPAVRSWRELAEEIRSSRAAAAVTPLPTVPAGIDWRAALRVQGFSDSVAAAWSARLDEVPAEDATAVLARLIDGFVRFVTAPDLRRDINAVVVVGPAGSGKSTVACRLANRILVERPVLMACADRRSPASWAVIEGFAGATGVAATQLARPEDLRPSVASLTIVDTAGLRPGPELRAYAGTARTSILLTLGAVFDSGHLERTIDRARAATRVDAVVLTHLDTDPAALGRLLSLCRSADLPVAYLNRSGSLAGDLEVASPLECAAAIVRGAGA